MKKILSIILTFSLFAIICNGQKVSNPKIEKVFLDETDKTKSNYTIIYPPRLPYTGYVFIIPGFGETAKKFYNKLACHINWR